MKIDMGQQKQHLNGGICVREKKHAPNILLLIEEDKQRYTHGRYRKSKWHN